MAAASSTAAAASASTSGARRGAHDLVGDEADRVDEAPELGAGRVGGVGAVAVDDARLDCGSDGFGAHGPAEMSTPAAARGRG